MARISFFNRSASQAQRFDALVRPHADALYRFAFRLLRNRADAEDLVQDVLVKLYPRTGEMADIRDLKPWLLRIVYHQFVDVLRKRRRSAMTVSDMNALELADPAQEPEHRLAVSRDAQRIRDAVARLNRDQQLLVGLHLIDGYTLEEVADVLDVPLGTLKSRLHRTRAQLKKSLQLEPFGSFERVSGHEV
jgi:RNA polymerase sigma factor (sigma-70 family)